MTDQINANTDLVRTFHSGILAGDPELFGVGDRVVVRGQVTAQHTGEMMKTPATDREIFVGETVIYRLENGKIVETWAAIDRLALLEQIGAVEPPTP